MLEDADITSVWFDGARRCSAAFTFEAHGNQVPTQPRADTTVTGTAKALPDEDGSLEFAEFTAEVYFGDEERRVLPLLIVLSLGFASAPVYRERPTTPRLLAGKWDVTFANGVVERCEVNLPQQPRPLETDSGGPTGGF